MLLSDTNPNLAMNAYGGAANGVALKLVNNCPPNNTDCTWTLHTGMLLSDTNSGLAMNAYGGAVNGTELKLVNNCPPNNTDCTWTLRKGMLLSDTNSGLAMNAYGGAVNGAALKLVNNCPPNNTDCTWTLHRGMLLSDTNSGLAMNAYGGAAQETSLKLVNNCPPVNTDCTLTYRGRPALLAHNPAWLTLPAGPGSVTESAAYYANTPILAGEGCEQPSVGHELVDQWWCTSGVAGAPATLTDWAQQLNLPQYQPHPECTWPDNCISSPPVTFYDNDSLAMGRNVRCNNPGLWFNGDRHSVGCLALNHGPLPGGPGFPNAHAALADAVAQRNPVSFSAIWASSPTTLTTTQRIEAPAKCNGQEKSSNTFAVPAEMTVHPGDVVTIGQATGSVWAGNALFGNNGPDGVGGYACEHTIFDPEDCPMPGGPLYGLVLRRLKTLNADGSVGAAVPHFIGSGVYSFTVAEHGQITLCVNGPYAPNWSWSGYSGTDDHGHFVVPVSVRRAANVSFEVFGPDSDTVGHVARGQRRQQASAAILHFLPRRPLGPAHADGNGRVDAAVRRLAPEFLNRAGRDACRPGVGAGEHQQIRAADAAGSQRP